MDMIEPTIEAEGFVDVAIISVFAKGNVMRLRLQNGQTYEIYLDGTGSDLNRHGAIPRIDNGEYVVLSIWKEKVVAVQVIGVGSTVRFAFTINESHPYPSPKFVPC
jgi:hypothetical protein